MVPQHRLSRAEPITPAVAHIRAAQPASWSGSTRTKPTSGPTSVVDTNPKPPRVDHSQFPNSRRRRRHRWSPPRPAAYAARTWPARWRRSSGGSSTTPPRRRSPSTSSSPSSAPRPPLRAHPPPPALAVPVHLPRLRPPPGGPARDIDPLPRPRSGRSRPPRAAWCSSTAASGSARAARATAAKAARVVPVDLADQAWAESAREAARRVELRVEGGTCRAVRVGHAAMAREEAVENVVAAVEAAAACVPRSGGTCGRCT